MRFSRYPSLRLIFSIPQGKYNTWTPISISNGRMYVREQDKLYSYNIKAN